MIHTFIFFTQISNRGGFVLYILTDGKNYVMENPLAHGNYIQTTYSVKAKEFTYKQAKSLLQTKKKLLSWIKNFYLVNKELSRNPLCL